MTTPANPAALAAFLHQQFENQRFRGESLKTLAFALPPETGAYLTETGELLLADVDAKRRILDEIVPLIDSMDAQIEAEFGGGISETTGESDKLLRLLALPYADRTGYRDEWRPA